MFAVLSPDATVLLTLPWLVWHDSAEKCNMGGDQQGGASPQVGNRSTSCPVGASSSCVDCSLWIVIHIVCSRQSWWAWWLMFCPSPHPNPNPLLAWRPRNDRSKDTLVVGPISRREILAERTGKAEAGDVTVTGRRPFLTFFSPPHLTTSPPSPLTFHLVHLSFHPRIRERETYSR